MDGESMIFIHMAAKTQILPRQPREQMTGKANCGVSLAEYSGTTPKVHGQR